MNDITIPLHAPPRKDIEFSPFKGVFVALGDKIPVNMGNIMEFDKK